MDQATPEGVVAPVEPQVPPTAPPNGEPPVEAVKPADPPKPEEKKEHWASKRIKEVSDDRNYWRDLATKLTEQQRAQPPPPQQPAEQPRSLKDFNYDERAYQDHLYTEARKHAEKAAKDAGEKWRMEQEAISRRAKFDERVAQFSKTVEDYSEVVTDSTPVSEGMADFLLDSEEAGAVMYYLGNNPDEARKLYYLSPAKAGRELQKLEDRLVAERKKSAEKPVSQAPPPAPKIEASTSSQVLKSTDPEAEKLAGDEWRKLREKEVIAARKKRRG